MSSSAWSVAGGADKGPFPQGLFLYLWYPFPPDFSVSSKSLWFITMVRQSMSKKEISYAVLILPLYQLRRKAKFLPEEQGSAIALNWDAKSQISTIGFPPGRPLVNHLFSLCLHLSANGGDINSHTSSVGLICLLARHWWVFHAVNSTVGNGFVFNPTPATELKKNNQ